MRLPTDLDPSTDQARQWLSDELAGSQYQDTRSLFQRLMDWLVQRLSDLQGAQAGGGVSLPPVVLAVVVVLLVVGLGYLGTRLRVESRAVTKPNTLLGGSTQSPEELRRQGQLALAEGRFGDAVLAWTRALARDAERRTLLPDARSMTAHEVGAALDVVFPTQADAIDRTIDRFDGVAYGDVTATRDDALLARDTDEALRTARPVLARTRAASPPTDRDGPPPADPRPAEGSDAHSVWMTGVGS
jgi:hypothetical protein